MNWREWTIKFDWLWLDFDEVNLKIIECHLQCLIKIFILLVKKKKRIQCSIEPISCCLWSVERSAAHWQNRDDRYAQGPVALPGSGTISAYVFLCSWRHILDSFSAPLLLPHSHHHAHTTPSPPLPRVWQRWKALFPHNINAYNQREEAIWSQTSSVKMPLS